MLDAARVKYLEAKFKKGSIEYVTIQNAKGMKRHEYAILVPAGYDPNKGKIPVIVSLHGRVINPKHPAFRNGQFAERAREAVWNNWFKTPAAELALVIAPTTDNNGFLFAENHQDELQALYRPSARRSWHTAGTGTASSSTSRARGSASRSSRR
jgi:hypothetical protein